METGKTTRYFKYAIGEIILVVIGILIALYINSSYTQYRERQIEKVILTKLLADIEADYTQLERAETRYKESLKGSKSLKQQFLMAMRTLLGRIFIKIMEDLHL